MNDENEHFYYTKNNEYYCLTKAIVNLIHNEITNTNIIKFMCEPNFDNYFKDYLLDILKINFPFYHNDEFLINEITNNLNIYYSVCGIPRCNGPTFITHINTEIVKEKLYYLDNIPQPEQRTDEWYIYRQSLITASSAWKILKSEATLNQYIIEKCTPINVNKYKNVNINSPFHKGTKYEPVSILIYEHKYNTIIKDYGCIPHNKYSFLGASPDGINIDSNSPLYGRMLEIKNIVNREINGIPKYEYWIQMQLQMEVCNLDECDFLETYFKEFDDFETYLTEKNNYTYYGIILMFYENNTDNNPVYYYMPLFLDNNINHYNEWKQTIFQNNPQLIFCKEIYYYLEKISCVLVKRNIYWFNSIIGELETAYNTIQDEKVNDIYLKRINNKKVKKNKNSPNIIPELPTKKCLIDISQLDISNIENKKQDTKIKHTKIKHNKNENIILSLDTSNI